MAVMVVKKMARRDERCVRPIGCRLIALDLLAFALQTLSVFGSA